MENPELKRKMILRLFPYLKNLEDAKKLQIDDDSIHYISVREYAEKITNIIKTHLIALNISKDHAIITDATAGVGGDTISFSMNFKTVYSIEIDNIRSIYLKNNIDVYNCKNVTVINNDCNLVISEINDHNIIFFDPPWEPNNSGSYKKFNKLRLSFGADTVESFCNKLTNPSFMKKIPELIVIKLPKNYDIVNFYKMVNSKRVYYYNLNKMIILVIVT